MFRYQVKGNTKKVIWPLYKVSMTVCLFLPLPGHWNVVWVPSNWHDFCMNSGRIWDIFHLTGVLHPWPILWLLMHFPLGNNLSNKSGIYKFFCGVMTWYNWCFSWCSSRCSSYTYFEKVFFKYRETKKLSPCVKHSLPWKSYGDSCE